MAARIALGLVAAAALAGFLFYVHRQHVETDGLRATRQAVRTHQPADFARARRLLQDSRTLFPGAGPELFEVALLTSFRRDRDALRILDEVVRREPSNLPAWGQIEVVARKIDPARAAEARRRQLEINPPVRK